MTVEDAWTKSICDIINDKYLNKFDKSINFDVQIKVPYALEIMEYKLKEKEIEYNENAISAMSYATDLLVYEKNNEIIKPRVIIESKYEKVTTHDAITYSNKAMTHKNVTPYLRYGIMLGNRGKYPLPGRLFRHGVNFDFMISFEKENPSEDEMLKFIDIVNAEIEYSREYEEIIYNSRSKEREKYKFLQKQFILEK